MTTPTIAIVTGASNGIGKATALLLAKRGVRVVVTYHKNKAGAEEVVSKLGAANAVALPLDITRRDAFPDFTAQVKRILGDRFQRSSFDYLVNNAGVGAAMPFANVTETFYDEVFDANFRGPVFLTQALLPLMADGGRIVNVSSSSSHGAFPGYSLYGPSKAAFTSWTRYMAKELAPRQIRVNAVSPGPVLTNLGDGAFAKHPEYIKPLADQTALGRIGAPEDIGKVIVSLVSDEMSWVTAQDVEVSGGYML